MKKFLVLLIALVSFSTVADAKRLKTYAVSPECNVTMPCTGVAPTERGLRIQKQLPFGMAVQRYTPQKVSNARTTNWGAVGQVAATILPHPAGCPRSAFCGCGAAVKVFGKPVRELYLAANWLKFPRAAPAPGMVAARRGHVFVIEAVLGNGTVMAYDANSGGRQTRLHARALAGYTVVNPHG